MINNWRRSLQIIYVSLDDFSAEPKQVFTLLLSPMSIRFNHRCENVVYLFRSHRRSCNVLQK